MTKDERNKKSEDLLENKKKIIELWKADEKVLALILARSIMTDKGVLEFCIESVEMNKTLKERSYRPDGLKSSILRLEINVDYEDPDYYDKTFIIWNQEYWSLERPEMKACYKNERSKISIFNKFLNKICGNKKIKK